MKLLNGRIENLPVYNVSFHKRVSVLPGLSSQKTKVWEISTMLKRLASVLCSAKAYAVAFALSALSFVSQAAEGDLINIDDTKTGLESIVFSPGAIVQPLILIIASVIMSVAAIWLVSLGIKWLLKFVRGGR